MVRVARGLSILLFLSLIVSICPTLSFAQGRTSTNALLPPCPVLPPAVTEPCEEAPSLTPPTQTSPGPTMEAPAPLPLKRAKTEKIEEPDTEKLEEPDSVLPADFRRGLVRFGQVFFEPARRRILELERRVISGETSLPTVQQRDAISGFVGPLEMVSSSVYATIPNRYVLSPGDSVQISYWGTMLDLQRVKLVVDEKGEVIIPQGGVMVVRGMTLDQFQKAVKEELRRVTVEDLELIATLDQLKSIQIFVTGEAFRPGSYAVSAATTLFNALYAAGGPSDRGSLRDIRLLRNQLETRVDMYDYLLRGDSEADFPLRPGDTIFIPVATRTVAIRGEVVRPGIYDLRENENIEALIALAGGIKTTGILQQVQIISLTPNKERKILEVELPDAGIIPNVPLYNGDVVTVQAILPIIENQVLLQGKVERPGVYALKPGMQVSDLFSDINRPLGEAYLERADLIRLNADKRTTTLIPVALGKALEKDPAYNIPLASMDRLVVYSKWEIAFHPEREVTVAGSVQRPGKYPRSDKMTLRDLLVVAGGVLPETHLLRADLSRYDFAREITTLIPVNLHKLLNGDDTENILLADRDALRVYSEKEAQFIPEHTVTLTGSVQRPGIYPRSKGMRLYDLFSAAGGPLPSAHDTIEIVRARTQGALTLLTANLTGILKRDPASDLLIEDEDVVMVRRKTEFFDKPLFVTLNGEVARPGTYPLRTRDARFSDILKMAGGFTPLAYPKGTVFTRKREYLSSPEQTGDLSFANSLINIINDSDYERQLARSAYLTRKEKEEKAQVSGLTGTDLFSKTSTIASNVGETTRQFVSAVEDQPAVVSRSRKFGEHELQTTGRLIVDIEGSDPSLRDGDVITVPLRPTTVDVVGAVIRPTTIAYRSGKAEVYIDLAGGYAEDANTEKVLVLGVDGSMRQANEVKRIHPGDVIYVPPKVITLEVVDTTDKIIDAVKYALTTIASVIAFVALIGTL